MLITIIYHTDYRDEAKSLRNDIIAEWSDADTNMMGINDKINKAKYQIQLDGSVVYSGVNTTDNATIIDLIEERL